MIDIIVNIDYKTIPSLLSAEKRSLGIIKSRIDYRRSRGQDVTSVDADMFRKRLFLSRIEDLKSLSGIKRHLSMESNFIEAVSRIKPDSILLDLPPEFKGREGVEIDIDMLLQLREKKYSTALRLCDKLERVGLVLVSNETPSDSCVIDEVRDQKEKEMTLSQLQNFEDQLPLMRKKIYKLFFGLERRALYSFIKNQMDEEQLSRVLLEAESVIHHAHQKRA